MRAFSTKARIRSTTDRVWRTLMDTGGWPTLDSSIDRVDGTPALGATVTVHGKVGRVTFAVREAFSGPLAPLITRSISDLQPSFDEFAANLRKRLEQP